MGAWGLGAFENDDALDWVWELESSTGTSILQAAFDAVNNAQYREAPDCTTALAAAEVVAAIAGNPSQDLPDEIRSWVGGFAGTLDPDLIKSAHQAADHVLVSSELQELWEETEDYLEWQSLIKDLMRRLE